MSSFFFRVLHTIFPHLRAHAVARSVTVARSSAVQASSSRRQERRWAIVCGSPQSQSTNWASSRWPHLLITVFARTTPVRSRVRTRQQSQSCPDPAGKDSATSSPILTEAGTSVRLSFQSSNLPLLADDSSGVTVRGDGTVGVWRPSFVVCVPCGRQQSS